MIPPLSPSIPRRKRGEERKGGGKETCPRVRLSPPASPPTPAHLPCLPGRKGHGARGWGQGKGGKVSSQSSPMPTHPEKAMSHANCLVLRVREEAFSSQSQASQPARRKGEG